MPPDWPGFSIRYRFGTTPYEITVDRQPGPDALPQLTINGQLQKPGSNIVELVDDGEKHDVRIAWLAASASDDAEVMENSR